MALVNFSLNDIGELAKDLREAITGEAIKDPQKVMEYSLKLKELEQAINQGQIEINKQEAAHPKLFIAGWRPALGWIGAFAIAYHFIIYPFIVFIVKLNGADVSNLPQIDFGILFNLILAMLGFGGLRTIEKIKNVQDRH